MTLSNANGLPRWLVLSLGLLCLAGGTSVLATEPATASGDAEAAPAADAVTADGAIAATESALLSDATAAALPATESPVIAKPPASDQATGLRFSFSGAPWREVLNWLAEESELALHVGDVPGGSFTYSDPATFSTDEAIARVNLFLIPQGFAVVRRGQLLSVISLGDPRSLQQLDALATLTPLAELDGRSDHEVVKCIVPLGTINAHDVTTELQPLMLMIAPVVLPKSNQLIVTETAGKIRSVLEVIRAMESTEPESIVQRFDLQHVDVDTVLMIAGSHLGLTAGATAGADISISTDATGKSLFVTGTQDKIERLQTLLKTLDVPGEQEESTAAMQLRSHRVTGDNLQAVYNVLQTVLAGKSLRLSMQANTSSIVALADDSVHQQIESTIQELQAPAIDFAVIDLHTLDPYFVVSLIGEMFGTQSTTDTRSWRDRSRSDESAAMTAPKVDADPGNRRLFVRGTMDQVAQIRQMVENLDSRRAGRDEVRVVPLRGQHRQQVLKAAERFWRGDNQVQILPSIDGFDHHDQVIERAVHPDQSSDRPVSTPGHAQPATDDPYEAGVPRQPLGEAQEALVSLPLHDTEPAVVSPNNQAAVTQVGHKPVAPIRGQLVPQGILLQSDDLVALDRFQDHLLEIAASSKNTPSPPIVYYLKYVSADDAVKMLADLLDGGQSLADTPPGTLINGSVAGASGYFGSFTTKREGMTTVTAGTATIVSDARLNRLIVQGTAEDVSVIEGYLRIIDKGNSITNIETFGRSHVIELMHTKAADVAEMVKQAYAGRIVSAQPNAAGQPAAAPTPNSNDRRGDNQGRRDGADRPTRGRQAEMTVAVHESSNSLVITAPDALFAEVEALIQSVDIRSEQVTEVIPAAAGVDLETILRTLNGETSSNSSSSRGDRRGGDSRGYRGYSRSR